MKKRIVLIVAATAIFLWACAAYGESLQENLDQANMLYQQGDYQGAIKELEAARDILKKEKNPAGAQQMQMNIGVNYIKLREYDRAIGALNEAKRLHDDPDPDIDQRMSQHLATAHYQLGHYTLRAGILDELLLKYPKMDLPKKVELLSQIGDAYRRAEIYSKAVNYYQQALDLLDKIPDPEKAALIRTASGLSRSKLGDFHEAGLDLEKALSVGKTLKNPRNLAEIYSNLAILHWDQGEYAKALEWIVLAKNVESKNGLEQNLGADLNNEGLIYKSVGRYYKALDSIEQAIAIARKIDDRRSEAIALSNRGLVRRIIGKVDDAKKDYEAALDIYSADQFMEGVASCRLGLGKLVELADNDYKTALDQYLMALEIYRQQGNLTYQAETLNQIGRVLKLSVDPRRTRRNLIFEEKAPTLPEIPPAEARARSLEAYRQALEIANKVNKKEAVWSAQQGIGAALRGDGKLDEAFQYYKAAIETVIGIRGEESGSELMADYLSDKDDLFVEAVEILAELYARTQNREYLRLQMEYQEVYKNEVMKVSMNAAQLTFAEPEKADLYERIKKAISQKAKIDQWTAVQESMLAMETRVDKEEFEQQKRLLTAEKQTVTIRAQKLDRSIEELLSLWRAEYPNDIGMFDSSAHVDIPTIQNLLSKDQALIQYFPLRDKLSILLVTQDDVKSAEALISYEDLASLIRDDFMFKNIEQFGHQKTKLPEDVSFARCNQVLSRLYKVLIGPIEADISEKKSLVVVPSKYISYVPFAALVSGFDGKEPRFLIYDKSLSYIRLSFIQQAINQNRRPQFARNGLIAVGNPRHAVLQAGLGDLPGAEAEVKLALEAARKQNMQVADVLVREEATENAWREKVFGNPYSIFYFATHGVPFAEIMQTRQAVIAPRLADARQKLSKAKNEQERENLQNRVNRLEAFENFCRNVFPSKSPLYGFLYMAYNGDENQDGVLTLKEILEMPDSVFKKAGLAILSACNTAVTYSPQINADIRRETQSAEVTKELISAGWTPGVDQICLTDSFMKRNFESVLGTLWFADDQATSYIISKFFEKLQSNPPAEALRQAQLEYLKEPPLSIDYTAAPRHAFFWAVSAVFGQQAPGDHQDVIGSEGTMCVVL